MSDRRMTMGAWLDSLTWAPVLPCEPTTDGMPYATHEAVLQIEGLPPLRCYILSDGQRVIHADDIAAFFGAENGGVP